jgi:uncharacterized protein (TIGR03545 family)
VIIMNENKIEENSGNKKEKKQKKKGPIRLEAVGPFGIFAAIVFFYFTLFLDTHLKWGLEFAATRLNGAEVNVDSLKTRFLNGSLNISRIQFTHPSNPERNRFEIGEIGFELLWDALLRAKFVTEDAKMLGIAANTKRDRPGKVLPPSESRLLAIARERLEKSFKERFEGSDLAGIVELLRGFDPREKLQDLGELYTLEQIQGLEKRLADQRESWNQALGKIPGNEELQEIRNKVDRIQATRIQSPADVPKQIQVVQNLKRDITGKISEIEAEGKKLQKDVRSFAGEMNQIDEWMAEDRRRLAAKLQLPRLDMEGLTAQLFEMPGVDEIAEVQKYKELARQYIPPQSADNVDKKNQKRVIEPRERAIGSVYQFGSERTYPVFWIRQAQISSKVGPSGNEGNLTGTLLNASSDQQMTGEPTVLELSGEFPSEQILGVVARLTLDHRGAVPFDEFRMEVASYPVSARTFSRSDALRFGLQKAQGRSVFTASAKGDHLSVDLSHRFSHAEYLIEGRSEVLTSLLEEVVNQLPYLSLRMKAEGKWNALKFDLQSNVGAGLAKAFQVQLQTRLDEARAMIEQRVQAKVQGQRKILEDQYRGLESQMTQQVAQRQSQAKDIEREADRKIKELESRARALVPAVPLPTKSNVKDAVNDKVNTDALRRGFGR